MPQESRRARILAALARRKRSGREVYQPYGRKTDAALFSGKRMDDGEEVVQYSSGRLLPPTTVFRRQRARPAEDDVLFSGASAVRPGDFDPYDPLLNGHSIAEPVSAAAAAAPQAWAESPVGHHGAAPAYQPEASYPPQQAYQPEPLRSSRLLISRQRGIPHRRRISLSQRRINSRFTIRAWSTAPQAISLSQRRISSRLTIRCRSTCRRPISLSLRRSSRLTIRMPGPAPQAISLSQRRISSRLTIPMPVNLRRRPISLSQRRISSRLTIPMPVSLRLRPISLSQPYQQPAYDPHAAARAQTYPAALRPACRPARAAAVSAEPAAYQPQARQFPTGARARGRAGGSETSAALLFRGSGRSGRANAAVGLGISQFLSRKVRLPLNR